MAGERPLRPVCLLAHCGECSRILVGEHGLAWCDNVYCRQHAKEFRLEPGLPGVREPKVKEAA